LGDYDFSATAMETRRKYPNTFFNSGENSQSRILSSKNNKSIKNSFRREDEIKTFSDEGVLRECVGSKPSLKALLKEVFKTHQK
jgi:hypothetical protein